VAAAARSIRAGEVRGEARTRTRLIQGLRVGLMLSMEENEKRKIRERDYTKGLGLVIILMLGLTKVIRL